MFFLWLIEVIFIDNRRKNEFQDELYVFIMARFCMKNAKKNKISKIRKLVRRIIELKFFLVKWNLKVQEDRKDGLASIHFFRFSFTIFSNSYLFLRMVEKWDRKKMHIFFVRNCYFCYCEQKKIWMNLTTSLEFKKKKKTIQY